MAAKKKVTKDEEDTLVVSETTEYSTQLSKAQLEFVAMMESYKKSNPAKYAQKEEGFIKKLNSL